MTSANALPLCSKIHAANANDFLTLKPAIELHAQVAFRHLPANDREEAIAEAVAAAFQSFSSLTRRGKDPSQFPSMLATRAVQHVFNCRRVGTALNSRDVFSRLARRRDGFQLHSLHQEDGDWTEALVDDTQTPVPDQVSFRCDFPGWLRTLTARDCRLVNLLAMGHSTNLMATTFGISPARISQLRRELHDWWQVFLGESEETEAS